MSKKAISAKFDPVLLEEADRLARILHVARNSALEEGLRLWVTQKSRDLLAAEMREASLATRKESRLSAAEWDSTLEDGLDEPTEE